MSRLPKVSCICLTYGRTSVLNESVYSFLIQDYPGEKELIILNDLEQLEIKGDFPNVSIHNRQKRYSSLGQKRNASIEMCTGEIILVWDDDDIFLPHRISSSVVQLANRPYVMTNKHIYFSENEFRLIPYGVMAQAVYYKSFWEEVNGYPDIDIGEDRGFEHKARVNGQFRFVDIPDHDVSYIYRWTFGENYHTSAFDQKDSKLGPQNFVESKLEVSEFTIEPSWSKDYVSMVRELVEER